MRTKMTVAIFFSKTLDQLRASHALVTHTHTHTLSLLLS